MSQSFLILFAGGIMLAAAISNPREVTLQWLRLGGISALVVVSVGMFFFAQQGVSRTAGQWCCFVLTTLAVLAQLALAQLAYRNGQRLAALIAFIAALIGGALLFPPAPADYGPAQMRAIAITTSLGVAAMTGLALMTMNLGHAYLTASKMSMRPFRRLNLALAAALVFRTATAVGGVIVLQHLHPAYMFWGHYGLFIGTRWLVGLLVPAVFIYMTDDCIRRRATQSATGILYVAAVLIFIGELTGLNLAQQTGLPF